MVQVIDIRCPGCGARVNYNEKFCSFCGGPIIVTSFSSVQDMSMPMLSKYVNEYKNVLKNDSENYDVKVSMAMCYLKLNLYDKALEYFENTIDDNIDNSELYFYYAVCLLKGKKAFLQQRYVIDKIVSYINAAIAIEPRGIYYYFLAYIKYDYFQRKSFLTSPNYTETLALAKQAGVSDYDISVLFELLHVDKPSVLN